MSELVSWNYGTTTCSSSYSRLSESPSCTSDSQTLAKKISPCLGRLSQIIEKAKHVRAQLFKSQSPPDGGFQVASLDVVPTVDHDPKLGWAYRKLRMEVLEAFGIEPTCLQRCYPPLGLDVRVEGAPRDTAYIMGLKKLLEQLISYAKSKSISLSVDFQSASEPTRSLCDTVEEVAATIFPELRNISIYERNRHFNSFPDCEILGASNIICENIGMQFQSTSLERRVFSQFDMFSSRGAAVGMILCDLGFGEQTYKKFWRERMSADYLEAGLNKSECLLKRVFCSSIEDLEKVVKYGSAIITVNSCALSSFLQEHYVVLDGVYRQGDAVIGFLIRDPYHAWKVLIEKSGFISRWVSHAPLLQIERQKPHLAESFTF